MYARNHLVLATSKDLYNWTICETILDDDTGLPDADSARFTGFHYVDWIFDEAGGGGRLTGDPESCHEVSCRSSWALRFHRNRHFVGGADRLSRSKQLPQREPSFVQGEQVLAAFVRPRVDHSHRKLG